MATPRKNPRRRRTGHRTPDSTPALQHRAPPRRNRLRHPRRRTHRTRRRDPRPPPARASPRTRKPNTISSQQHEKEKMSTPLNWLGKKIPKCHIYSDTPHQQPRHHHRHRPTRTTPKPTHHPQTSRPSPRNLAQPHLRHRTPQTPTTRTHTPIPKMAHHHLTHNRSIGAAGGPEPGRGTVALKHDGVPAVGQHPELFASDLVASGVVGRPGDHIGSRVQARGAAVDGIRCLEPAGGAGTDRTRTVWPGSAH